MLPYWFLFGVTAWMAVSRSPAQSNPWRWPGWWWIFFTLLVLIIGLRHEVGGDWGQYIKALENTRFGNLWGKDPAYGLLNILAVNIGGGVYLVNTICAAFFSFGLIVFCRAQPRPWLALLIAVPYLITVVAMGYTRQGAALGFVMLGLVSLSEQKLARFAFFILLATTFHKSAVVLMPLAVFAGNSNRFWTALWVGASSVVCYMLLVQDSVAGLNTSYIQAQYQSEGAGIRVAMNVVPAIIFLFMKRRFSMPQTDRMFWTWMSFGALIFVGWLSVSPSSTAVDRMALYWIPLQLFVLSRLPDAVGKTHSRAMVFWILAYCGAVQFVWLTSATNALYWLPYQFYPWVALWR